MEILGSSNVIPWAARASLAVNRVVYVNENKMIYFIFSVKITVCKVSDLKFSWSYLYFFSKTS